MVRDFGAGMTVDELIGMPAWHISRLELPPGEVFKQANWAAGILVEGGYESYLLAELWEDGHTLWHSVAKTQPVVVTPSGKINSTRG